MSRVRDLMSHVCREAADGGRPAIPGTPHRPCTGCGGCPCHHVPAPRGFRHLVDTYREDMRRNAPPPEGEN